MRSDDPKPSERPPVSERRSAERIDVTWSVDCETEDTFLYASITDISELGVFVRTQDPLELGTRLTLRFAPPGSTEEFVTKGQVQWINPMRMLAHNPNPGMGVRFVELTDEARARLIDLVHTIAYVRSTDN